LCNARIASLLLQRPPEALPAPILEGLGLQAAEPGLVAAASGLVSLRAEDLHPLGPEALALGHEKVVLHAGERRRESGAFYTPAPVARHLCRLALADQVRGLGTGGEPLALALEAGTARLPQIPGSLRGPLASLLSRLSVCDPAAGGGAFLAAMFHELGRLQRHAAAFLDAPSLLAQLHGVDLDAGALACCKGRLLLQLATAGADDDELCRAAEILHCVIHRGDSLLEEENPALPGFSWNAAFAEAAGRGGFDIVVGNPPFLRIQRIPPWQREPLRRLFNTARGKYDAAGLFVEQALRHCGPQACLALVLPSRLFTAAHGTYLREHLRQRDACLSLRDMAETPLFGQAAGYAALARISLRPPAKRCGTSAPLQTRGKSRTQLPLERICSHIFQGLISGGDRWFYLEDCGRTRESDHGLLRRVRQRLSGQRFWIEERLLKPLLKGRDLARYTPPDPTMLALYPYDCEPLQEIDTRPRLLDEPWLREEAPHAWRYLRAHAEALAGRGSARMRYPAPHAYWCPRRPGLFAQPKLLVQTLALRASFTLDPGAASGGGFLFAGGGNAGVYGLVLGESPLGRGLEPLFYLLCLLNSRLLQEMVRSRSGVFRGGYVSFGRRYIAPLPIALPRPGELREGAALARAALFAADSGNLEEQMDIFAARLYT